jgi:streptomycin 6-kinase
VIPVEVPEVVQRTAAAAGAGAWLSALPDLVESLADEWGLEIGRPYSDGTEAFVTEARVVASGALAVLKVAVPHDPQAAAREIEVLRTAGGSGCALLLASDAARGALLLERLGPSMHDLGLPLARRLPILCDVASRVWRTPTDPSLFRTGAEKARWLVELIDRLWGSLGRPCSSEAIEHAHACAERRAAAHSADRAVLLHGDVHEWNTLRTLDGGGYKLVDPDGLVAEPEYDLGILMREDPVELLEGDPRARSRWLAARTGLDEVAIWEWGVLERVSTGLLGVEVDLQPVADQMLAAADRIALDGA